MNNAVVRPVAVYDDQEPEGRAQPQEEEPLFLGRVVRIVEQERRLVAEGRLRLGEGDAMLAGVRRRLGRVPSEPERLRTGRYIRRMYSASTALSPSHRTPCAA